MPAIVLLQCTNY